MNLIIAVIEEMAYRKNGMYDFKSNKAFLITMLFISSILFGFSHYYNFEGSFLATGPYIIAGFILGISYLVSKNVWVPIISHLIFNSTNILSVLFLITARIISLFN